MGGDFGSVFSSVKAAKAGNKKKLADSAVYPRAFGYALAALLGERTPAPKTLRVTADYRGAGDDLGALDDFLFGRRAAWWRSL